MTHHKDHPFFRVPAGCAPLTPEQTAQRLGAIETQKALDALRAADTPKAYNAVADTLEALSPSYRTRVETLRFAASSLEKNKRDPVAFTAIHVLEEDLTRAIRWATSTFSGGVEPPTQPECAADYAKARVQRETDEWAAYQRRHETDNVHPINRIR
ncbi:hypothetical protein [Caballeronia sp. LZ019]|uniref:hypothetical protein n=1 Tax=Caballeronia sp. LZ019 TaxID=3038555 RepID=UPI0028606212|nr:hypothetical protein [Caballeronia sp. LZ019]MDR5811509.1 hypothetical protein [Caballeronia sp. LZ019]